MDVPLWLWIGTVVLTTALLLVDVLVIGRRPHEPSTAESVRHLLGFVGLAVLFGLGVWVFSGADYAGQFFAGWVTEYSLSVDNLFVFLLIMSRLSVPRQYQATALLVGIVIALVLRGLFIGVGAAAINQFSWVFYLFGLFLVYTAVKLVLDHGEEDPGEPAPVRWVRTRLPFADDYDGVRLTTRKDGRRVGTPMLIVVLTLGMTDLLFALDSIPAIYGLTNEPYLVFAANVFALMGLRQLYFLIGDLLDRLVYLSYGLAVLLAFIGVKLVLHALHENEVPFLNGGRPVEWAPDVPTWLSLVAIVVILGVTTVASLLKDAHDRRTAGTTGA
ncbi:TerC family protein [Nocardioides sp. GY 10127]|uniref:TerC family protein n=1 Tax=Nocardioides sp. GY 10127 TaxID=2569762 RepID=UPI0010A7D97F|nr:TerC family protein [Nocardioides sp. GY 10127]TIC81880.1 TerC family protein [Nocardioides sp. GY 10127]